MHLAVNPADSAAADPATWPIDDDLADRVRLLGGPSALGASELSDLLYEDGDVPHLKRDLFEIVWEGALFDGADIDEEDDDELLELALGEGVVVYRDEWDADATHAADAAIAGLVTASEEPVLVVWSSGVVGWTDVGTVRERWASLLRAGFVEDLVAFPVNGEWALCASHSGSLEVGRLREAWPHAVSVGS